jgi:hypothetical protein
MSREGNMPLERVEQMADALLEFRDRRVLDAWLHCDV